MERAEKEHRAERIRERRAAAQREPPGEPRQQRHAREQHRSVAAEERAENRGLRQRERYAFARYRLHGAEVERRQRAEQRQRPQPRTAPCLARAQRLCAVAQAVAREDEKRRNQRGDESVVHMDDAFHQRQPHEPLRRDHGEDHGQRRQRAERHGQRRAVGADAPEIREQPEHAEQHEKIERGIDVPLAGHQLAGEKIVEQSDEQTRRELVGGGTVVDRETALQRFEKDHPQRRADGQERDASCGHDRAFFPPLRPAREQHRERAGAIHGEDEHGRFLGRAAVEFEPVGPHRGERPRARAAQRGRTRRAQPAEQNPRRGADTEERRMIEAKGEEPEESRGKGEQRGDAEMARGRPHEEADAQREPDFGKHEAQVPGPGRAVGADRHPEKRIARHGLALAEQREAAHDVAVPERQLAVAQHRVVRDHGVRQVRPERGQHVAVARLLAGAGGCAGEGGLDIVEAEDAVVRGDETFAAKDHRMAARRHGHQGDAEKRDAWMSCKP